VTAMFSLSASRAPACRNTIGSLFGVHDMRFRRDRLGDLARIARRQYAGTDVAELAVLIAALSGKIAPRVTTCPTGPCRALLTVHADHATPAPVALRTGQCTWVGVRDSLLSQSPLWLFPGFLLLMYPPP
jgi:hypothetical protein